MAFIIAEIGTSHEGNLEKARALVDCACDAGADAVKFQWVYAEEILHPKTGFVKLPTGNIPLYDRFKALECPFSVYEKLRDYSEKKGVKFVCSPFGLRSLVELLELSPYAVKIASPELNHYPLLHALADYRKNLSLSGKKTVPVILSSGVSTLTDIEKALDILSLDSLKSASALEAGEVSEKSETSETSETTEPRVLTKTCEASVERGVKAANDENGGIADLTLLHCITSYPAPESEYNLRLIENLSSIFGLPCGLSDHSLDPVLVPVLSILCGGKMIEKHITLSRKTSGLDDPVALEGEQFALMVHAVHQTEALLKRYGKERGQKEMFSQLSESYPMEKIQAVLGNGVKKLAPSEKENYGRTNRSLHYMKDLPAGKIIEPKDLAPLRTEKVLEPGISPEYLDLLLGKKLCRPVQDGAGVKLEDFMQ